MPLVSWGGEGGNRVSENGCRKYEQRTRGWRKSLKTDKAAGWAPMERGCRKGPPKPPFSATFSRIQRLVSGQNQQERQGERGAQSGGSLVT